MMPGVVSLPHGWGHDRPGTRLGVASATPGATVNDVTSEELYDALSGNAALSRPRGRGHARVTVTARTPARG